MKDENRFTMPFRVGRDFYFEASHFLTLVPKGHKCGNMHGHSYHVRVHAKGFLDRRNDWVLDYAEIDEATDPLIAQLDHTVLNDVLPYETTAENLAFWFGQNLCHHKWLHAIEVFETRTASVFFEVR